MEPHDLERLIDRELKRLAVPRAPSTLLPRVLDAAARRSVRPWARPWIAWPRTWQLASVMALALMVAALAWWWPSIASGVASAAPAALSAIGNAIAGVADDAGRLAIVGGALVRVIQPLAAMAFVVVLIMAIACLIGGAALRHVAFGEAGK